jgi:hypothetical protein
LYFHSLCGYATAQKHIHNLQMQEEHASLKINQKLEILLQQSVRPLHSHKLLYINQTLPTREYAITRLWPKRANGVMTRHYHYSPAPTMSLDVHIHVPTPPR